MLCYKSEDEDEDPSLALLLHNYRIVPISQRDIGKPCCFAVTVRKRTYFFAAANPKVFLKWLNVLSPEEIRPWHLSTEDIYYSEPDKQPDPFPGIPFRSSITHLERARKYGFTLFSHFRF